MRLMNTIACAALVALAGSAATAATFDFAQDAENFFNANGFEGTFDQVYGGVATDDGISVTASATEGSEPADPFMDSRGNNDSDDVAGLGVCSSGDSGSSDGTYGAISDCSTNYGSNTGDDNLLFPEILTLTFSGLTEASFKITSLFIRDANHDPITDAVAILINGDAYSAVNGVVNLAGLGLATVFSFTSTKALPEIYLSTLSVEQVPVPAAGFLLLGGLGGLAAMKRRKKA